GCSSHTEKRGVPHRGTTSSSVSKASFLGEEENECRRKSAQASFFYQFIYTSDAPINGYRRFRVPEEVFIA
ncbi:hypothetical protein, partial [Bacteroides heparinolyticus]|uniref:hypothetical protein n=1 Tax=Prevotella heparinolytica TaxID=28113 RepID=UPI00359F4156